MTEKRIYGRAVQKHDVEKNWIKATNFIPMAGEVIVYDRDDNVTDESLRGTYSYERFKIGDGVTLVNQLPFADANKVDKVAGKGLSTNDYTTAEKTKLSGIEAGANKTIVDNAMSSTSTNPVQNKIVNAAISAVSDLVGGVAVSEQIEAAQIVYVGPTRPTDPNIKVWINTAEEGTGIVPVLPRVATITLSKASWAGNTEPYSQVVEINTVTSATKIDLQPTASQIVSLQNAETTLMIENNGGVVTCYAIGNKPAVNYTMQVLLQEVAYV